jgi:plasmid stability protein
MNNIQYTVRNVPDDVDNALRLRAAKKRQSFNTTLVQALRQATTSSTKQSVSDLDWFYGSGGLGQAELDAFAEQRVVDKKSWNL